MKFYSLRWRYPNLLYLLKDFGDHVKDLKFNREACEAPLKAFKHGVAQIIVFPKITLVAMGIIDPTGTIMDASICNSLASPFSLPPTRIPN